MPILMNTGPQTFPLGKNEPPHWNPLRLIKGSVRLVKFAGEYDLVTETECYEFATRAEAERYRDQAAPAGNRVDCGNPGDPGYDIHIKGDCYIVLTLADDLDGWMSSDDAIQTASRLPNEYFQLRYWDKASWVERADGIQTDTICFGARWKAEIRPDKEVHKIWYAFKMSGNDNYFDPDVRNPQDP